MGRGVAMRRGRQRRKESAEEGRECTRRMTGVSAPVLSEAVHGVSGAWCPAGGNLLHWKEWWKGGVGFGKH